MNLSSRAAIVLLLTVLATGCHTTQTANDAVPARASTEQPFNLVGSWMRHHPKGRQTNDTFEFSQEGTFVWTRTASSSGNTSFRANGTYSLEIQDRQADGFARSGLLTLRYELIAAKPSRQPNGFVMAPSPETETLLHRMEGKTDACPVSFYRTHEGVPFFTIGVFSATESIEDIEPAKNALEGQ